MNLKNKSKIKSIKFNSESLFIFLISFSIIALLIGMLFYFLLGASDKNSINSSVIDFFSVKDNYNYIREFVFTLLNNTYSIVIVWILGISVIGVIACVFLYFCELFSVGFTIASIFNAYKSKGILVALCYLIPTKICYLIAIFLLSFFAIKISYKIIEMCFSKKEIDLKFEITKYFKVLLFSFMAIIAISVLSVFINPILFRFII